MLEKCFVNIFSRQEQRLPMRVLRGVFEEQLLKMFDYITMISFFPLVVICVLSKPSPTLEL